MKKIFKYDTDWFLLIIILLASLFRLWKLNIIPPSLTPDEASLGYNAYSILKTGKDEFGSFLPLIFKSFGDYKPGLYIYLVIPFITALGLNEWAVRLPSAIAGIISVFILYKISKNLFPEKKYISLAVALTAALNPWLIYFSRGAWEANVSLTLTLSGIYFYLRSIKDPKKVLYSAASFALTLITYQGAKLSTVIVGLVLILSFPEAFKKLLKTKYTFIALVLAFMISTPAIMSLFNGQTGRLKVFSVFSYPRPKEYTESFLNETGEKTGSLGYYLYHSEALNFKRGIFGRWFNHFSGKFLFFEGDYQNPRQSAPYQGMLLLGDIILLPLGIVYFIKSRKTDPGTKRFVFLWLILSPLSAALSRDQVQAVRALNMSVPLIFVVSAGLYYLPVLFGKYLKKDLGYLVFIPVYVAGFIYFFDAYFIHMPIHSAKYWYYGYKELMQEIIINQDNYDKVIVQQSYSQPYIYYLFYKKFDPKVYQSRSHFIEGGLDVGFVGNIDKLYFEEFSWPPPVEAGVKTLVAGDPVAVPPDFPLTDYKLIKEIKYPDGYQTAFRLLEKIDK